MKASLFYLIFGALIITIVLQAIMFASTGIQLNQLQKKASDVDNKLDKLQIYIDSTQKIINKIGSFIDEPLPEDSNTNPSTNPEDLLSPENINKTLGI